MSAVIVAVAVADWNNSSIELIFSYCLFLLISTYLYKSSIEIDNIDTYKIFVISFLSIAKIVIAFSVDFNNLGALIIALVSIFLVAIVMSDSNNLKIENVLFYPLKISNKIF